jgi:hypothetical protein
MERRNASQVGAKTGLGTGMMKQVLPLVAALVTGAMSRNAVAG